MKLPNYTHCVIAEAKLTDYLLAVAHPDGAPKAKFLAGFGFPLDNSVALRVALLVHAEFNEVIETRQTEFGTTFAVEGPLASPDGRDPIVRVVWMIDIGTDTPRLITLVPA